MSNMSNQPYASPTSVDPSQQSQFGAPQDPPKKRGCGCASGCVIGCLGMMFLCVVLCAGGGYYGWKQLPNWVEQGVVTLIDKSELPPDDKTELKHQVQRVSGGLRDGSVSFEQFGRIAEKGLKKPFTLLLISLVASEHVQTSGLSDEEKEAAKRTIERIARGLIEDKVKDEALDQVMSSISLKDQNGVRQPKKHVTDEELRAFLKEAKRLSDEANIPDEPYEIRLAPEFKKVIDEVIGAEPGEMPDISMPPEEPAAQGKLTPEESTRCEHHHKSFRQFVA